MAKMAANSSSKGKAGSGKESKEWERKLIVIKKRNPQKLMENFFPVTKPKRAIPEKNFQGFPLSECRYVEDLHEYVYCPPKYGRKTVMMPQGEWTVCPHCLLNPCMKVEKWDDIMGFCGDQLVGWFSLHRCGVVWANRGPGPGTRPNLGTPIPSCLHRT